MGTISNAIVTELLTHSMSIHKNILKQETFTSFYLKFKVFCDQNYFAIITGYSINNA